MTAEQDAVRALQGLGLTEYESRVYLALLEETSLSGYAVARASGVPRSKVYEVIEGLVRRGIVLTSHGGSTVYAALPPADLIALRRRESDAMLAAAELRLQSVTLREPTRDVIWDIVGRDPILERLRQVIARASHLLLIEIWAEDAPGLRSDLEAAAARGVEVVVIAYDDPGWPFATTYLHEPGAERVTAEHGGRWIILSADGVEVVAGNVSMGDRSRAAWTTHPGLVMPITQQIQHDVYIAEMLASNRDVLEAAFGPGLEQLRTRFSRSRSAPLSLLKPEEAGGSRRKPSRHA